MHYFFAEAQKRNVKRLMNLTQIHASNEKEWIVAAKKSQQNKYSDRYVLTNRVIEGMEDHVDISACHRVFFSMLSFTIPLVG